MLKLTEAQFSAQVEDLLKVFGWRYVHFRPARIIENHQESWRTPITGSKGFPDIVAVRQKRLLFIELKSTVGKLSLEQEAWLELLGETSAEVYLWRPDDFKEIEKILSWQSR